MIFHQNLSERTEQRRGTIADSTLGQLHSSRLIFKYFLSKYLLFHVSNKSQLSVKQKENWCWHYLEKQPRWRKNWTWTWNIGWRGKQIFRSLFKSLKLVFWAWFTWTEKKETAGYYVSTASTFQHKLVSKISQIIFNRNLETCHNIAALEYFQGLWIW